MPVARCPPLPQAPSTLFSVPAAVDFVGGSVIQRRVAALAVIEHLDVFERGTMRLIARGVVLVMHQFLLG
jgi:hypothetical protein